MKPLIAAFTAMSVMATPFVLEASSHREAPLITELPKVDASDFYMFKSYEAGRDGFVTLIANYLPLQDAYGGPNYFTLDDDALYEIHIDNNADGVEDISFQFKFKTEQRGLTLDIDGTDVAVPLAQIGSIGPARTDTANLNVIETYSVSVTRGDRRTGVRDMVTNEIDGTTSFSKPVDNIGTKTLPDYAAYASDHIYNVSIPGCNAGRVFVGQRKESFVVNLGETFDLINTNPLGAANAEENTLDDKNVTTLALEVPVSCLVGASSNIIGGWTTASLRQARILNPKPKSTNSKADAKKGSIAGGAYTQVSRLGAPLVNEVVIGLPDKNRFNHSEPVDDAQFATYVTNPTLPKLIEILFGVTAPTKFPRTDLVSAFLTGVEGLNKPPGVVAAEVLRLNTDIEAKVAADQKPLGVLAADTAGFPNGRRPGDDVVDIALRVVMGVLLDKADAPSNDLAYTDGAYVDATFFDESFPYLKSPLPGSPN